MGFSSQGGRGWRSRGETGVAKLREVFLLQIGRERDIGREREDKGERRDVSNLFSSLIILNFSLKLRYIYIYIFFLYDLFFSPNNQEVFDQSPPDAGR